MPIPSDQKHGRPRHSSPARNSDDALETKIGCKACRAPQPTIFTTPMIRSIAFAAGVGALVAAGALYAAAEPSWRGMIAAWFGASEPPPEAKLATEDWAICTTLGSMGSEARRAPPDPGFPAGAKGPGSGGWDRRPPPAPTPPL